MPGALSIAPEGWADQRDPIWQKLQTFPSPKHGELLSWKIPFPDNSGFANINLNVLKQNK